nr:hypothetical protein [Tanacetum cinerariifolium]
PADQGAQADTGNSGRIPDRDLRIRFHRPFEAGRGVQSSRSDTEGGVHGRRRRRDQNLRTGRSVRRCGAAGALTGTDA